MRSPRRWWLALLDKEWRELLASRAWWVFLIVIGPLVGVSFISAVQVYAEASGLHGTAEGVGEAFSPLIGVWGPTFSACELAAAFLWPFVVIRLVGGDRQSGALKIELQHPASTLARLSVKILVLVAAWVIATTATVVAIALWIVYGGAIYPPEIAAVVTAHGLNALLTIGIAAAAAAVTEHPSTAAIVTLGLTVGTWIVNFVAAIHGGFWERLASYTPTAMVAELQHGLVRLAAVLVVITASAALITLAGIWLRLGVTRSRRIAESFALSGLAAMAVWLSTLSSASWDLSENRANSFSRADEAALRRIDARLRLVVHLAPQDPRRSDLDRHVIAKLNRVLPQLDVEYESATSIGLFEQTSPHYGEIWYDLNGRQASGRSITPEGVLDQIYALAEIKPQAVGAEDIFRGHPLPVAPRGAAVIFYGLWPAAVVGTFIWWRRTS